MHGPKGTGTIAYQEGSTVGTTTSASNSFKTAYAVSVNTDGGYFGDGGGNELQFGYAQTITDNHSLDIKVSKTASVRGQGSDKEDGVNNDNDVIYLALSPTVDAYFAPPSIKWTFLRNYADAGISFSM
jgi:hypothetical protein